MPEELPEPPGVPEAHLALIMAVGLAVLEAQRLESVLKYSLIMWNVISRKAATEAEVQQQVESRRASRSLLNDLKKESLISASQLDLSLVALDRRDFVVHRLVREQGQLLASPAGKAEVFRQAGEAHKAIQDAVTALAPLMKTLGDAVGIETVSWQRIIDGDYPGAKNYF